MNHSHLERVLALACRTGDRVIVVDRYEERAGYAVLPLDEYERLIDEANEDWFDADDGGMNDLTMDDWTEPEESLFDEPAPEPPPELDNMDDYGTIGGTFPEGFTDVADGPDEPTDEQKQRNRWEIAREVKQAGAADALSDETGFDDERYYLESI